jgi:hypothetical protein
MDIAAWLRELGLERYEPTLVWGFFCQAVV